MRRILLTLLLLTISVGSWPRSADAQDVQYDVKDLIQAHADPGFDNAGLGAYSINDDGVIVGFTGQTDTKSSPFYTVDGKPTRVKSGEFGATFGDINSDGVIVGREVTQRGADGSPIGVPAMWVDEQITRLEIPADPNGGTLLTGAARSINNDGLIVGDVIFSGADNQYVVVWTDGVASLLPDAYGYPYCQAWGLDESGIIGGSCWSPDLGSLQPVVWIDGQPQAIDGPPNTDTSIYAITDTADGGYVMVGLTTDSNDVVSEMNAVVYENGNASWLPAMEGFPQCRAFAVSETPEGILVGGACTTSVDEVNLGYANSKAALWLNGELVDLDAATGNDGEWNFMLIRSINESGQMIGLGERNGERRSFLLTPA